MSSVPVICAVFPPNILFLRLVYIVALERAVAPHSSTLAWKIPRMEGSWWAAVHGVAKSQTGLSDFPFTFHFHAL